MVDLLPGVCLAQFNFVSNSTLGWSMVVRPSGAVTDARVSHRSNGLTTRHKRGCLAPETSARKRRKVDTPRTPQSPSIHIGSVSKQVRVPCVASKAAGSILFVGVGDTGQLGLGPDIVERSRPARLNPLSLKALRINEEESESYFVQVVAGGMHTVGLTSKGDVVTCGCNDEGALGRVTAAEDEVAESDNTVSDQIKRLESVLNPLNSVQPVDESRLGFVSFPAKVKIVMVSAGDSHTAALDSSGQVWLWGTFRGASGPIGLTQPGEVSKTPRPLLAYPVDIPNGTTDGHIMGPEVKQSIGRITNTAHLTLGAHVVKIASGQDHLICLTDDGRLYTMGCGEQGQLGRIAERFAKDGGRSGISSLLQPTECRLRGAVRFSDAWAGGFATFARCSQTGAIYACGLNNYGQLALVDSSGQAQSFSSTDNMEIDSDLVEDAAKLVTDRNEADKSEARLIARQGPLIQFMLTRAFGFHPDKDWCQFSISMHHTLALDGQGKVFAVGRPDYGRLGLGKNYNVLKTSVTTLTRVTGKLTDRICSWIGCGESCSYAVDEEGTAYSWGMGSNHQLAHGDDDDDSWEPELMQGKQLQDRRVLMVDAGGQHAVILACSTASVTDKNFLKTDVSMLDLNETMNGHAPALLPQNEKSLDSDQTSLKKLELPNQNFNTHLDNGNCQDELILKAVHGSDSAVEGLTEPILIAPISVGAPQTRRNRRASPSSITGSTMPSLTPIGLSCESTTGSTAGATINSSVHSSAVSDTSSVGSCASNSSTSSQLNSAKSTDGGGSSRCSSFDTYSVQSSLLLIPSIEETSSTGTTGRGHFRSRALLEPVATQNHVVAVTSSDVINCSNLIGQSTFSRIRSGEMSICSTSSEPGIPTDTTSLGSMTASPADVHCGEQPNV